MLPISFDDRFSATLADPLIARTRLHSLRDIVTLALFGMLCGAESWVAIEQFGMAKRAWFERFLRLRNGIPSHDTFGRVFAALDPAQFETGFLSWVRAIVADSGENLVAIDGKTPRHAPI